MELIILFAIISIVSIFLTLHDIKKDGLVATPLAMISFLVLVFFIIVLIEYISDNNTAKYINKNYGTNYSANEVFWSGAKIKKKHGIATSESECEKEPLAKFIIDCAGAANPLSDAEGEGLVSQCAREGRGIFCK